TKEWWIDRFENNNMKVLWSDGCTLIAEEKVIETKPVNKGDRILVGIPTKDRPQSLTRLLKSLKDQTFNDFDVIVVDDSVADIRQNAELREAVIDISKNGHIINVVKGVNLNQAVAHNHILNHAILNDYKLVFRVDDDITLDKHHLSRIFSHFVKDRKCEYAAMGGIFLNPYIDDKVQVAPEDWNTKEEFSGNIDVCTNTAQIVSYPENIKYRDDIQHLYSSYVYRPELMKSVGGFPTNLSMVGFREETLGLYELYLSGYKMKIVTNAKGYHWNEQTGGCRSVNESVAMDMYLSDNKIFRDNIRKLKDKYGVL
ncbi:MAG: glycosyltransferase family A protein, partial [Candidatus Dojkabacteria bacterium]